MFPVGSAPGLYKEDPQAGSRDLREFSCEAVASRELRELSCGIFAEHERLERGKLKKLHCSHPLPGNGC
jgi:hypothetical protein